MKLETAQELIKLEPAIEMLQGETKRQIKALLEEVENEEDEVILKRIHAVRLRLGLDYGIAT
jgi:hypothetical protein